MTLTPQQISDLTRAATIRHIRDMLLTYDAGAEGIETQIRELIGYGPEVNNPTVSEGIKRGFHAALHQVQRQIENLI